MHGRRISGNLLDKVHAPSKSRGLKQRVKRSAPIHSKCAVGSNCQGKCRDDGKNPANMHLFSAFSKHIDTHFSENFC
jgi:hypothetical protein